MVKMFFSFCTSKRQTRKKGKHDAKQAPQKPHEQACAALNVTPTPKGQVETERLLSGDVNAAEDLKHLLARAEEVSRRTPRLNLNVRATERWLQGSPEAIEDLVEEHRLAQMRAKKAASQQWVGFSLMRDSSLVGESFKHSFRKWCGDDLSTPTEVIDGECRGHWRLHYCLGGEGCSAQHSRPVTPRGRPIFAGDTEGQTTAEVPFQDGDQEDEEDEGNEENEDKDEDGNEDFPFDDYFPNEENYQQALCEATTAFPIKPAQARAIFIPAGTAALRHKRGQASLRELSSPDAATNPSDAAPPERLSTQARTDCRGPLSEDEGGGEGKGGRVQDVPRERGARRFVRLSLIAGPLSGPPAVPLPPSPPVYGLFGLHGPSRR